MITGTIWRDISELLRDYVLRTDKRRAQLADMKRLDAESAAEISQNQERIDLKEVKIMRDSHTCTHTECDELYIRSLFNS